MPTVAEQFSKVAGQTEKWQAACAKQRTLYKMSIENGMQYFEKSNKVASRRSSADIDAVVTSKVKGLAFSSEN